MYMQEQCPKGALLFLFDGRRQRVLPLLMGHTPPTGPVLVALEVHDIQPIKT